MNRPRGYDELIDTFGDIEKYLHDDGTLRSELWEPLILDYCTLPFIMLLSWDKQKRITRFRCHQLLIGIFSSVFEKILDSGLSDKCQYFGGCYAFRPMRRGTKTSTHAWGIAIDINPDTNPMGQTGLMDPGVIEIFESFGFIWGGEFGDPMHFQWVEEY